ncbi:hypothetical protein CC85DRAFT_285759 [Cutaneotrichosporon oleaginosum]|uniref:C2H2-type domain-containing protein n=1 Tax=Cutaneotrichosporon oleaginosum TaxID=879819 RepID=A0A0J0XM79_9TREE|nr:uncharacterized protein CC85DRAFT_285759 [Cutaneotrichosporon oleaginosum]KLT42168.1 hypothetical protein CC85DRAFT_285759 [Cutaneotrichosporon oleaginosum]TXT11709.1 hypothetical protein COLE_02119 [Cutaneotrichosporon oleaginosum]
MDVSAETSAETERKRARSPSPSPSPPPEAHSPTPLDYHHRPTKFHRAPSPSREYLCTLPPTCSQPDTAQTFATEAELEAHQERLHRWMCRVPIRDKPGRVGEGATVLVPEQFTGRGPRAGQRFRECGKVFPNERLLDLHYTETHDPIARERLERGEKIYECFLPPDRCDKVCLTLKKRRRHLIDKHGYPNTYYFSITAHGLNRITREDGPGASLIRPYRPAPEHKEDSVGHGHGHVHGHAHGGHAHAAPPRRTNPHHAPPHPPSDMDIDDLTSRMGALESSLAFVPRNVRRAAARRETRAPMEVG